MCYADVEAATFRQAALALVADVDQLPDVHNIQCWVELSEYDLVVSDGRVLLLFTCQWTFADLAAFEQCGGTSGPFKFVGVSISASQGLSRGVYCPFRCCCLESS